MPEEIIQQLIKGEYLADGKVTYIPVKSVEIKSGLVKDSGDLIASCGLKGRALIVSDINTHVVLGAKIEVALGATNAVSLVFEAGVKPDLTNIDKIKSAANGCDYIIAVGSGTINDLCKYASFLINKPYVVFGTAPSMNGYGSANASITIAGHKKTVKAHLPLGIFLDLDILAKAPVRLIRSGLGDSLCRGTAQADWLLSHLLLGTFYSDIPFALLNSLSPWERTGGRVTNTANHPHPTPLPGGEGTSIEADLFANSKALVNGDAEIMRLLATTLVLSGFGMYLAGGSYPASQGEHMIAHTMEMAYGDALPHSYHGEQIGITTLSMARLQENILINPLPVGEGRVRAGFKVQEDIPVDLLNAFFGEEVAKECLAEYSFKKEKMEKSSINERFIGSRDDIIQQVSAVMVPYDTLLKTLKNSGCPLKPEDIGWQASQYANALKFAKFSRDRFTFLDLV